ncbi:MAG: type II secretion system protein GspG [Planctomycetes bacterium]|nr:type II secretion system protein GspG [Planctomycetota bacterium]
MSTGSTQSSRPQHWSWLLLKILLLAALLPWFAHFAYVHITTPPGQPGRRAADSQNPAPPPPDEGTRILAKVLDSFPARPVLNLKPPPGMRWDPPVQQQPLEIDDVRTGPWDLDGRPFLRAAAAHLASQPVSDFLASLIAVRGHSYRVEELGTSGALTIGPHEIRRTARLLVARARYQHAERHDVAAAWGDLKTGLWLAHASHPKNLVNALVGLGCEATCTTELMYLTLEADIPADLAAEIDKTLRELPSLDDFWRQTVRGELSPLREMILSSYTDNGHGNGWLVLSALPSPMSLFGGPPPGRPCARSRLWNLCAPLYYDRQTALSKLDRLIEQAEGVAQLPYQAAQQVLFDELEGVYFQDPLAGPVPWALHLQGGMPGAAAYSTFVGATAHRRATRIMLALNLYHARQGHYPTTLSSLVPEFIDDLPPDPYTEEPFRYRPTADAEFILYSCGRDGVDNGGVMPLDQYGRPARGQSADDVYTHPRWPPIYEPTAVPLDRSEITPDTADGGTP